MREREFPRLRAESNPITIARCNIPEEHHKRARASIQNSTLRHDSEDFMRSVTPVNCSESVIIR